MKVADLYGLISLKVDKGSISAGERALATVNRAIVGLVSAVAVKTVGSFFTDLIKDTADMADGFRKASAKIGITAENLQQLSYAAELADVDSESLQGGLLKLARSADAAARGGKEQAAAFRKVG